MIKLFKRRLIYWRLRNAMRRDDYERAEELALLTGDPELRRLVLCNRILKILNDK